MSEGDERLREASDPTTPGERLVVILDDATGEAGRRDSLHEAPRRHGMPPELQPLRVAVLRNPALPLTVLRAVLRQERTPQMALDAWHNPVVPLLLQSEPTPDYHEAARRLLATLTPHRMPGTSLESLVREWRRGDAPGQPVAPHREGVRALARRLGDLFLPS